jgi:hypothetical protein
MRAAGPRRCAAVLVHLASTSIVSGCKQQVPLLTRARMRVTSEKREQGRRSATPAVAPALLRP